MDVWFHFIDTIEGKVMIYIPTTFFRIQGLRLWSKLTL